ncbi:MAG: hypothetical protein JW815_04575 [Candidatus Bathyarchaeota archaeon]|nr:hypothetical protein [Candidatus Bathyarchaeum sp.]
MGDLCPFKENMLCKYPNGKHFDDSNFVGCKIVDYGNTGEILWICPYFPKNLSITDVRDIFMGCSVWDCKKKMVVRVVRGIR